MTHPLIKEELLEKAETRKQLISDSNYLPCTFYKANLPAVEVEVFSKQGIESKNSYRKLHDNKGRILLLW